MGTPVGIARTPGMGRPNHTRALAKGTNEESRGEAGSAKFIGGLCGFAYFFGSVNSHKISPIFAIRRKEPQGAECLFVPY